MVLSLINMFSLVQFSLLVLSDSLRPHGLQHTRLPCLSLTPGTYSNSCPFNHLILCCPLLLLPSIFPSIRVFSNESVLHITWPKYWSFSFSISPSSEYSGLISLRVDWFDLPTVQGTLESFPAPQFESITSLACSLLYGSTLTSIHGYWKNHDLYYTGFIKGW